MNPMPIPHATTTFVHHNAYVEPHNVSSSSVLHKPKTPKGLKGGRKSMTRNRKRCARKYKRHSVKRTRARRGGNMFHGSYPEAPVVCLAGASKIPCTAFSAA